MMLQHPPTAWGPPVGRARIRVCPEDFIVHEQLGFDGSGSGEHAFLHLEKRLLTTLELEQKLTAIAGVPARDIGYCGMKDRNAVTRQWFSVGLAGKQEPDWHTRLAAVGVTVLEATRHTRKLKRGVHQANQFQLRLRSVVAERAPLIARLQQVQDSGVPNYFGPQRFGRGGNTLQQARRWMASNGRKITRTKRSLFLSALRAFVFNEMLAARVQSGSWTTPGVGDFCMLQGSRSRFAFAADDPSIASRAATGDLHPGLPLWGVGELAEPASDLPGWNDELAAVCSFLERMGLVLDYRASRLFADDFCWRFCDDGSLELAFSLGPGGYATAILAELLECTEGEVVSGDSSE